MKILTHGLQIASAVLTISPVFGQDLLHCQSTAFFKAKCSVEEISLLTKANYQASSGEAVNVDTKVSVNYSFPCSGHAMDIGVSGESCNAKFVFNGSVITLTGTGPFSVKNFSPGVHGTTYLATVNPDCELEISSVSRDLSDPSIQILKEKITSMKSFNDVLASVKESQSLIISFQGIVANLDTDGIKNLLSSAREEATSLKASAQSLDAQDALDDTISEIDLTIAINPALDPNADIKAKAQSLLARLDEISNSIRQPLTQFIESRYQDGMAMLNFANENTKSIYQPVLNSEHNKHISQ